MKRIALEFTRCLFGLAEGIGFVSLIFLFFGRTQDGVLGIVQVWNDSVQKNGLFLAILLIIVTVGACYLMNRAMSEMVDILKKVQSKKSGVKHEV